MAYWVALTLLLCVVVFFRNVGAREHGLPPGPPTLPIIGNLHLLPTKSIHHKLTEWARKYGGLYSLKLGSGTAILISDPAAIKELLDKRSATTGDRPLNYIADLLTGGLNVAFSRYNDTWKTLRKAAHTVLTPKATALHLPIQRAEAAQLLHDILCKPESFHTHIGRYSNSFMLSVIYGTRAPRYETPETTAYMDVERQWSSFLETGATPPVDMFPLLRWIPERWAKWKREAKRIRTLQRNIYFSLLSRTEERIRKGEQNGSYAEELLAKQEELKLDREMIGYIAGSLVGAATETTSGYMNSLILALVAHPEAQKRAHEEIDCVVGQSRLPTLDDLEHMPYIRALILENHRFRPVVPLYLHASLAAEEYRGYLIPSGSTIFVNTWGIYHDPEMFDEPESFRPERYLLAENGTKPGVDGTSFRHNQVFGAGRRICAGILLAQQSININVMNFLWAFDFKPDVDLDGHEIKADTSPAAYYSGLSVGPFPFKCRITPRTAEKAESIRQEFFNAENTFEKFEFGLSSEDKEFVGKLRRS